MDVALFSALHSYETITEAMRTGNEATAFEAYHQRIETGADVWYDMISMFYKLQNLITKFVTSPRHSEAFIRTVQGNPYSLKTQERARALFVEMNSTYERVMATPGSCSDPGDGPGEERHPHLSDMPGGGRLLARGRGVHLPALRREGGRRWIPADRSMTAIRRRRTLP